MKKEFTATASTVEDATAIALSEINAELDDVDVVIVEEPGKKLFGGKKDAVVKVIIKNSNDLQGDMSYSDDADENEDKGLNPEVDTTPRIEAEETDVSTLSDEEVDAIADTGIEHLKKLISFLSDKEVKIEEFEGDEGEIILDVTGEDAGVLIGRHGRTIDALQSVVSAMTTKKAGIRYPLAVDVEGYKHRRKQKVVDIAKRAADRARRTNKPVSLKAMSPYERRVVHMVLRNQEGVSSTSEGSGSYRHVVVIPH